MTRSVPQKNESPIPLNGPIKATLMLLIEDESNSGSSSFCSSIAIEIPNGNVLSQGVTL